MTKGQTCPLTAMVVGSMIGSGVFLLRGASAPRPGWPGLDRVGHRGHRHADAGVRLPAPYARKPDLDAGIFTPYAKAGFGDYVGFSSAFGFLGVGLRRQHLSGCSSRRRPVRCSPRWRQGPVPAIILASVGVWLFLPDPARGQGRRRSSTGSPPSPRSCRSWCSSWWRSSRSRPGCSAVRSLGR